MPQPTDRPCSGSTATWSGSIVRRRCTTWRFRYTIDRLKEATLEVVRVNRLEGAYIRPVVFVDAGTLSVWTKGSPVSVAIAAFPTGTYLAGAEQGVRVTISPVRKYPSNAIPAAAKACGQYINSARAVTDAQKRGFDEAILLNQRGEVSEGSGENIFVVKNGRLLTNGIEADILMGVTRDSILQIASDLKIPAQRRHVDGRRSR